METKEWTTIDRSQWPPGPWDDEPDKVQWQDEATLLPCLAVRHPTSGHWCGYVGVAPGHRYYEEHYDEADADVHGGLTFSDKCQPGETEASGICHVPAPGEPDHVWWLGFDCAHCDDSSPLDAQREIERYWSVRGAYRTLDYVKQQCRKLAAQLV